MADVLSPSASSTSSSADPLHQGQNRRAPPPRPCTKAKGVFLIVVTSLVGNSFAAVCDMNLQLPFERDLDPPPPPLLL
ncbi:hypothetical protein OROMI_015555 [Orobanche minor]